MPRERTLTQLELIPATVSGQHGWAAARWERSDGSSGRAFVQFRQRKPGRWYIAQLVIDTPTSALLRDVPLTRIESAANAAGSEIRQWIEDSAKLELQERRRQMPERHRLKAPTSRRLDDAFYREVATAYQQAAAWGLPPTKTLAEDSDTPPGTINRWIAEARKRRYLPKTTRGKASY
jgi:hypothetical protein